MCVYIYIYIYIYIYNQTALLVFVTLYIIHGIFFNKIAELHATTFNRKLGFGIEFQPSTPIVHSTSCQTTFQVVTLVVGDPKAHFSITPTPKCRGVHYSIPRIALQFTLDTYLIMLSVKQGGIKYLFWVFGMTRPGLEPRSVRPLANTTHGPVSRILKKLLILLAVGGDMPSQRFLNKNWIKMNYLKWK